MKRANKVLTVLLILALILTPILKPEFSVLAEEGDPVIEEEETPEAEESEVLAPEIEAPETEDPEIEEPETETPEAEGEFIPDEEVEVIPEDEVTPEDETPDSETSNEEAIPDQVTPEEETPDPGTPGEEGIPEEETPEETEDTVTPEETSEGIHFAVEEMTEADLEALPLSALLGYLRDGDGNALTFPESVDTLWFRIIDGNGNVVYNESYGVNSDAVLNLRQYFVTPGYTLELTAGTGEREQPGNTVYQVEMGSAGYQTDPVSLNDHEKVYATYSLNGLDPVVKWKEIFENLYDRDTGAKVEIPPDSVVMWRRWFDDDENPDPENYVRVNPEDEVDLAQEFSLELLVGEGNQWTVDSTELIVEIIPVYPHDRTYHLARETDAGWIKLAPQDVTSIDEDWFEEPYLWCEGDGLTFVASDIKDGDTYYVGIDIPESDWNSPYWDITVYDMNDALASDDLSKQIDVTSQIVNQPMDTPGAGYPCTYRSRRENVFAVVFTSKDTGEIIGVESVRYGISTEDYKISGTLLTEDGEQVGETLDILDSFSNGSFVPIWRVPYSDWTSRKYYLKLNIQSSLENPIVGIVEGYCKSWDEAYAKLEAEGDLLPALKEGYTTEALKGEGTDFVILCNNHQVRKFHVSIKISVDLAFTGMLYDAQGQEALQDPLTFKPASYLRHGVIKPGYSPDDTFFFRLR